MRLRNPNHSCVVLVVHNILFKHVQACQQWKNVIRLKAAVHFFYIYIFMNVCCINHYNNKAMGIEYQFPFPSIRETSQDDGNAFYCNAK